MSETQQIPPGTPLSVTMTALQWNSVLQVLGEGPFRLVGPLINAIQHQCMQQTAPPEPEHIARPGARANGGVGQMPERAQ
jgi:hypothetical protein